MKKTLVLYIGRGFNFFVIPPDIQMYTVKSGYMFPVTQEMRQRLLCLEKSLSQPAGIISDCSLEVIFIQQILAPVFPGNRLSVTFSDELLSSSLPFAKNLVFSIDSESKNVKSPDTFIPHAF